jgi:predicted RNA-binding Zn-ribbon protein involved in translation (DUF1610 family)
LDVLREIAETLQSIKRRSPQPKFCPNCKSHKIYPNPSFGILPTTYSCKECEYEGTIVLEIESEKDL